uniref:Uncharacterized protein n=1 Tax=Vespula pensylvanica TaxID=30213 RepID=A0A834K2B9_VESPE|nr:hypothetical protein H0235_016045 [Vespula pensylvanica]
MFTVDRNGCFYLDIAKICIVLKLSGVVCILCVLVKRYKGTNFDSGFSHATNFHHSNLNTRGTHAPHNETEWWGYCATWGKYKAAAFGSGSIHDTNFHHSHLNPRDIVLLFRKALAIYPHDRNQKPPLDAIGASIDEDFTQDSLGARTNEDLIRIYKRLLILDLNAKWGYSASRDDNKVGSLNDHYNFHFALSEAVDSPSPWGS